MWTQSRRDVVICEKKRNWLVFCNLMVHSFGFSHLSLFIHGSANLFHLTGASKFLTHFFNGNDCNL